MKATLLLTILSGVIASPLPCQETMHIQTRPQQLEQNVQNVDAWGAAPLPETPHSEACFDVKPGWCQGERLRG